jgi:hypothetical protein
LYKEQQRAWAQRARKRSFMTDYILYKKYIHLESKNKKLYSEQVGREIKQKRLDTVDRQAGKAVQSSVSNSM